MKRKSLPTGRDFLFVEGYGNENPGAFQSPRPLRGATCRGRRTTWRFCHFNPRAPCGARHGRLAHIPPAILYFNPRAPCGARHRKRQHRQADACISIHAPLAGRDRPLLTAITSPVDFNPRAPCGARHAQAPLQALHGHISIHAPLAGRDSRAGRTVFHGGISIHAPLTGRDAENMRLQRPGMISIHAPLAGRDIISEVWGNGETISIHAPLAGRDSKSVQITMHIFAITDKFQMFLRKMPTVRAFCSFFVREKRANFSANRPDNFCALVLRTIRSSVPRADTSACSRSVRFYSRTSCPSSKIEGCPFPGQ